MAAGTSFTDSGDRIAKRQLQAFERRNRVSLPVEYSDFLLKQNGGRPSESTFDVPGWPGKAASIHYFLYLKPGKYGIQWWLDELSDRLHDLPPGFLPIAVDEGGNFVLMGSEGSYRGKVYYWDSSPDWGLTEESGTVFLVAHNLNEFIANLYDDTD